MRVGRREVRISNPDTIFFPSEGITKGDLVPHPD
jgi:DNA primase